MGTRESRQVQARLVRSDKPTRRERPDDLAAVRLVDSTRRSGEPATWGSGQRKVSRSTDTWAPDNGRIRPSMQREEPPAMETGLERIAAKARCEPRLRFRSLAHHLTKERVWENLCQIRTDSAPGTDGQTVPRRRRASGSGLNRCFNPFIVRGTTRRTFGACIFQSPESARNARSKTRADRLAGPPNVRAREPASIRSSRTWRRHTFKVLRNATPSFVISMFCSTK